MCQSFDRRGLPALLNTSGVNEAQGAQDLLFALRGVKKLLRNR